MIIFDFVYIKSNRVELNKTLLTIFILTNTLYLIWGLL